MFLSKNKLTSYIASAIFIYTPIASAIEKTDSSCYHSGGVYMCENTYEISEKLVFEGVRESPTPSFSYNLRINNGRADAYNFSGETPTPNVSYNDLETSIEIAQDRTVWTAEEVADFTILLGQVEDITNFMLDPENYNLTKEARDKLKKVLIQRNAVLSRINALGQVSNHLLNQELELAGSELAGFIGSLAAGEIVGFVVGGLIGSPFITAGAVTVASFGAAYIIEENLDSVNWSQTFMRLKIEEGLLDRLTERWEIEVWKFASSIDPSVCEALPPYKQRQLGCLTFPIMLDLDGNGIEFIDVNNSNYSVDISGNGIADKLSWPTPGNAVLFMDIDHSDSVNDKQEFVFSMYSVYKKATDFDGLASFDYNSDGTIDILDPVFAKLRLWDDKNSNGKADEGEVIDVNRIDLSIDLNGRKVKSNKLISGNKVQDIFNFRYIDKINNEKTYQKRKGFGVALDTIMQ